MRSFTRLTRAAAYLGAVALGTLVAPAAAQEPESGDPAAERLPARLVGQVISDVTGQPLVGATVSLRRARRGALADSSGHFSIPEALGGIDTLEVRYVGYEPGFTQIELEPQMTTNITLLMSPTVVRVADLQVQIEQDEFRLGVREFERRRAKGVGQFFTRDEIERMAPQLTSDVLRRAQGLRVGARGRLTISRNAIDCFPAVFVNGLLMKNYSVDDVIVPDLGAIEVYTSYTQIPAQYASLAQGSCGAILIWTRRGNRPGEGGSR